jgi:hypothetical protein
MIKINEIVGDTGSELDPQEEKLFRTELLDNLAKGPVTVGFLKVNGDERVMKCTLSEEIMPHPYAFEDARNTVMERSSQSVWDIEANDWRSFRFDKIQSILVVEDSDEET